MQSPDHPTLTDYNQAVQRCAEAYHHVRAELKKGAYYQDNVENQQRASLAYIARLPILCDPASFQLYIACVAQGVGIGAVDVVDAGRLCHLAQTAMSAWKLANLIVPAAQRKEKETPEKGENMATLPPPKGNHLGEAASQSQPEPPAQGAKHTPKGEEKATPLPSKGNHSEDKAAPYEDWESLYAATKLPDWETQTKLFQSLRDRGADIPTDEELRDYPAEALRHCETARYFQSGAPGLDSETGVPSEPPQAQPAKEQPPAEKEQPMQAA